MNAESKDIEELGRKIDILIEEIRLMRKDIEGAFFGEDFAAPPATEMMNKVGLIPSLHRIEEKLGELASIDS